MNKDSYHSMKRGLALSLVAHVILLSFGAVYFISPVSLPQQLEAIPITLAPLSQELSSQQGAVNAPVRAIPAVKPTVRPQEKEDALHVGEGKIDSLVPFRPKEKLRTVETAPSPSGEEKTLEKYSPELTEQELSVEKIDEPLEKTPEEASEVMAKAPLGKIPEESSEVMAKAPLGKTPEESSEVMAKAPLEKTPEESSEVMAKAPLEKTPEEAPEVMAKAPLEKTPEEASEVMAKAPLEKTPEEAPEVMAKAPLEKTPEEAPEVMAKAPLEKTPEEAPEVMAKAPLEKTPEEASEVMAKAPLEKAPEEASEVMAKAPLETHKNEEFILPQKLIPRVGKMPVEETPERQQAPQIMLPGKSPFPQFKPKSAKKSALQTMQDEKKKKHQRIDKSIEDILALEENNLLNRVRTQGGGAKRSNTPEALGARKNIDDTTKMAQTLVNLVGGCIQQKLKLVALGGDLKNRPVVRLRFYLNREGMVIGDPVIDPLGGVQNQQAIMIRQVYAAVFSCQPYADLPRDQYDLWGQGFDFNVDPLQEITR
ncbi:cell envelope biogenesis protein TolA [Bartonella sp. B39]